jgi:hypothetical protein
MEVLEALEELLSSGRVHIITKQDIYSEEPSIT